MKTIYLFFVSLFALTGTLKAHQIAATPPMGWNSYNCYGPAVHEDEVKANARYLAKYLKPYGWQYVVADESSKINLDLSALGFKGKISIRDLWKSRTSAPIKITINYNSINTAQGCSGSRPANNNLKI